MAIATARAGILGRCALGAAVTLLPVLAVAQSPAPVAPATRPAAEADGDAADLPAIKGWFADLINSDAVIRAAALNSLMGLHPQDLAALKRVVEENRPLAPAQATVLRQIVTQVVLAGEPYDGNPASGFLGIRMEATSVNFHEEAPNGAALPTAGVVIVERMPGFSGARMLRDGDVILSILERPNAVLRDPADFALLVREMGAGATVHFQLLRQGQVIRVPVKLDPRPVEADQGFGISELLERRREHADAYWTRHFAALVRESVS